MDSSLHDRNGDDGAEESSLSVAMDISFQYGALFLFPLVVLYLVILSLCFAEHFSPDSNAVKHDAQFPNYFLNLQSRAYLL
jgi:hypothetical protein